MELLELITTFQDLGFECEEQLSKRKKNKFESNKEYHYYFKKGEKIISIYGGSQKGVKTNKIKNFFLQRTIPL